MVYNSMMIKVLLIVIALLTTEKEDFRFAMGLYNDGLFTLARKEFTLFLKDHPESPYLEKAEYYIAKSDFYIEDYSLAKERLLKFIADYPFSKFIIGARFALAKCYFELGEYPEAILIYRDLDTEDSRYWLAESYYRKGDLDTALYYFKTVPSHSRFIEYAIYSSGFIEKQLGRYETALLHFERLIDEYPEGPLRDAASYHAGEIYYKMGDYKKAESLFLTVVDGYRDEVALFLAHIHLKLGLYDKAREGYSSLLGGEYNDAAILGLGDVWYREGELDSALAQYKRLKQRPSDDLVIRIGRVYFKMKLYDSALVWLGRSDRKEARLLYANVLYETRRYSEAYERYQTLYEQTGDEEALYRAGLSLYKMGDRAGAYKLALEYLKREYKIFRPHVNLIIGEIYYGRGEYNQAAEAYSAAGKTREGLLGLAYSYNKIGDRKNAITTLTKLVNLYPDEDVLSRSAEIAHSLREYEKAKEWYAMIEGGDFKLGKVYLDMGKHREAIDKFERFIGKFPMNRDASTAQYLIGTIERTIGNLKGSKKAFGDLLTLYPSSDYIYSSLVLIGHNYFDLGEYDSAIVSYRRAIAIYPDSLSAIEGVINAEYRARGFERAILVGEGYIKSSPRLSSYLFMRLGDLAYQHSKYRKAIQFYSRLNSARALYWKGMSYYSINEKNSVKETFLKLIDRFPEDKLTKEALLILADIYIEEGDLKAAERYLISVGTEQALLKVADVQRMRGDMKSAEETIRGLIKRGGHIGTKAELMLARISIERGDRENVKELLVAVLEGDEALLKPEARFLLGEFYFAEGDYESAARAYLMVNYLYGENEFISIALLNAAESYIKLKKIDEARKFYMMVIERDDDSGLVEEAKKRLEEL